MDLQRRRARGLQFHAGPADQRRRPGFGLVQPAAALEPGGRAGSAGADQSPEGGIRGVRSVTFDLHHGDCLEVMAGLPDASVDMILCDLPYGTTACKWDTVIPFEPLWAQYRRVAKRNAAIVLTATQPFASALVMSNVRGFRHEWVWDRVGKVSGHMNANRAPMRRHELVPVFGGSAPR